MRWAGAVCVLAFVPAHASPQKPHHGEIRPEGRQTVRARATDTTWTFPPAHFSSRRVAVHPVGGGGQFVGLGSTGQAPANCDLAVGPSHVVQVVNSQVAFFTKGGALEFQQDAAAFFGGLAQTPSPDEPRAVYDRLAGRFVIVFVENDQSAQVSNALLAVSDDDDPNGVWFQYRINVVRTGDDGASWFTGPSLGYNADGVVLAGANSRYATGAPNGSSFHMVAKAPLLTGSPLTVVTAVEPDLDYAAVGESAGSARYVFGAGRLSSDTLRVYGAKDVGTATPVLRFVDVNAVTSSPPPALVPSTDGAMLETNGARVMSAHWRGERLITAYNVLAGAGRSGVRWHAFSTAQFHDDEVTSLWFGLVSSGALHYFVPTVALNAHLDAALAFTGSSTSVTSDIVTVGRTAGDPSGFMSPPVSMAWADGSPYNDTRWGAYFGAAVDPVDGETFWTTAMTVRSDGSWDTQVLSWSVSKTWPVAPFTDNWFRGTPFSGNTASLALDDDDYLVAKAGITLSQFEPPVQLDVFGVAPFGQLLALEFDVVAKVSTPGLTQRVLVKNVLTGLFEVLGAQGATVSESLQTVAATGDLTRYVLPATNIVQVRVQWFQTGVTLGFPWSVSVDQAQWRIRVR